MIAVGSLCSGYGGLDLGLALGLGVELRHGWHVEYDKHPSAILAHRFPGVPNYGDVKTTDWASLEPIDWLTAGYPCQPFSLAGLRKGADDPRHLWPGVARAISVLRPRGVLLENVAAHLRDGFDTVLGDLAEMGYDATWGVVRASDAGAPHGRARLFVVAHADDADGRGSDPLRGPLGRDAAPGRREGGSLRCATPDPDSLGHERSRGARDGRPGPADSGHAAPDSGHDGRSGHQERDSGPVRPGLGTSLRDDAHGRAGAPPAHTTGDGRGEGRPEPARQLRRPDAALGGAGVPTDPDGTGSQGSEPARGLVLPAWGAYEPAVRRWEHVLGRAAPRPTEPGRTGERLSPRFVEWMMGLPAGWVTDVPGLPRNAQLKALGNGVVPQQAALAVRLLSAQQERVAA